MTSNIAVLFANPNCPTSSGGRTCRGDCKKVWVEVTSQSFSICNRIQLSANLRGAIFAPRNILPFSIRNRIELSATPLVPTPYFMPLYTTFLPPDTSF